MVASGLETSIGAEPPHRLRERLERRRVALREAVRIFREHAVGMERLELLRRTEDELAEIERRLARLRRFCPPSALW